MTFRAKSQSQTLNGYRADDRTTIRVNRTGFSAGRIKAIPLPGPIVWFRAALTRGFLLAMLRISTGGIHRGIWGEWGNVREIVTFFFRGYA